MDIKQYKKTFKKKTTLQYKVFNVLSDTEWHCRVCDFKRISTKQLAGGGGIQVLQRGTKTRPGLEIETSIRKCPKCKKLNVGDRWTGEFKQATAASNISDKLMNRIMAYYNYVDAIEQRQRLPHELVVDHRFPMKRYGEMEDENPDDMSEEQIQKKFQLLKKDSSGNHNLLKSRACENCKRTGKRGTLLGIDFFYLGGADWPEDIPQNGMEAKKGCEGCAWYDVNQWRLALNEYLKSNQEE